MSVCPLCGDPVDPMDTSTWRRVVGWERKAIGASRKAGSDIVLREPRDEHAHNACVHLLKTGVNPRQVGLLG